MKLHLLPILALFAVVLFAACSRKTAVVPTPSPAPATPGLGYDNAASDQKPDAYQVVGYQKTACFGKCPVYQVKFFSDGTVTWFGQHNVERKGWFETRVENATLKSIRDKAQAVMFWDFLAEYPHGHKVADLPSTVTYIRAGDMEKTVVNTHQGPLELEALEDFIEGIINVLEWRPSAGK